MLMLQTKAFFCVLRAKYRHFTSFFLCIILPDLRQKYPHERLYRNLIILLHIKNFSRTPPHFLHDCLMNFTVFQNFSHKVTKFQVFQDSPGLLAALTSLWSSSLWIQPAAATPAPPRERVRGRASGSERRGSNPPD